MTKEEIINLYTETLDFHKVQRTCKLPPFRLHMLLTQAGVLRLQDKVNFGSKPQRLGGKAEELFQKLVPEAIDANRNFRKNNPQYDYVYKNLTIDVKYSSLHARGDGIGSPYWKFRASGNQDVIVAFFEREKGSELDDPIVVFLPMAFVPEQQTAMQVTAGSYIMTDFQIEAYELSSYIKDYAEMKGAYDG